MQSSEEQNCVIVGASHAGTTCAMNLRRRGWLGSITLVGAEAHLPYHRPPLSKDYLKGVKGRETLHLSNAASYEKSGIDLRLGQRIEAIDRDQKCVSVEDGSQIDYDALVLATGARARKLTFDNASLPGVCYLRDMHDVDRIREAVSADGNAVIIGGGYIGLEAAASLRALGMQVTVLEAMDRVLQRVTSEPVSSFFTRVHREEGVDIRERCQVTALIGGDSIEGVQLASGEQIDANLVVIGIGVLPNVELAVSAGLKIDNGISIDEFARTDDPTIYAIGDCASFVHSRYDRSMRLESVQNANDLALTAVKSMLGQPEAYVSVPWFWSDQYDIKLQIVGLADGADEVIIRGDAMRGRSFSVLYLRDKQLLAVDAINSPRDFVHGKKLILSGDTLNAELLANADVPILQALGA